MNAILDCVFCTNIEHKMGLHGSATFGLSFGENGRCPGLLLGEPQAGMAKRRHLRLYSQGRVQSQEHQERPSSLGREN